MTDTAEAAVEAETPAVEAEAPVEPAIEEAEVAEVEAAAPPAEINFTKVIKRHEDADITHYTPIPHTELDPSTRY